MTVEDISADEVADRAMRVASQMCVYTNDNFLTYTIDDVGKPGEDEENK